MNEPEPEIVDPLFEVLPSDYAPLTNEPRLPLLTMPEARLVVEVLLTSEVAGAGRLGRDLARRLPTQ
jgi:hypothetical protein